MANYLANDLMEQIDEQVNIALSRYSFWEFCLYYDINDFFIKRPFLKEIAEGFQDIAEGRLMTISVSMPPRAGKSYLTSLFCAWWLGKNPTKAVMRNTVTSTLYRKFSYDVRQMLKEKRYRNVFPSIELASDKQNIDGWSLVSSTQGAYFGGGVSTNIIGYGCNLAITDDLYSGFEQALSEVYNDGVFRWKQGSHDSRKEKHCPEIYIGTRWSKKDVIGEAIESGKVEKEITIPALDADGKSFCDEVKTTAEYLKMKRDMDESIWVAEYMQEPAELEGLLFPSSELKYFDPFTIEPEYKYLAVDPADIGNDDTSAPFCDLRGTGIYVSNVLYNNNGTDVNIPAIVEMIIGNKVNHVEIEGVSAWVLFAKDVRSKVNERFEDCEIRITKANTNKNTRILTYSAFIKNHFYFLKEEYWTPEYRKFMKVLTSYMREGGSKRDDAPDSLAMAAAYFMKTFGHLW